MPKYVDNSPGSFNRANSISSSESCLIQLMRLMAIIRRDRPRCHSRHCHLNFKWERFNYPIRNDGNAKWKRNKNRLTNHRLCDSQSPVQGNLSFLISFSTHFTSCINATHVCHLTFIMPFSLQLTAIFFIVWFAFFACHQLLDRHLFDIFGSVGDILPIDKNWIFNYSPFNWSIFASTAIVFLSFVCPSRRRNRWPRKWTRQKFVNYCDKFVSFRTRNVD